MLLGIKKYFGMLFYIALSGIAAACMLLALGSFAVVVFILDILCVDEPRKKL